MAVKKNSDFELSSEIMQAAFHNNNVNSAIEYLPHIPQIRDKILNEVPGTYIVNAEKIESEHFNDVLANIDFSNIKLDFAQEIAEVKNTDINAQTMQNALKKTNDDIALG